MKKRKLLSGLMLLAFSICFALSSQTLLAQPSNDLPCDAISIDCGETLLGSTLTATESGVESPTCANGSLTDVFYEFVAFPGVNYEVLVNGSDYDGVLVAYTGNCNGPYTELDCSDNIGVGVEEEINFEVSTQSTVLIRTYDWSATDGSFEITLNCSNQLDIPCDAQELFCGDSYQGTTIGATATIISGGSNCGIGLNPSVFYTLTTEPGIQYVITFDGDANFDPSVAGYLYNGACDELEEFSGAVCGNSNSGNGSIEQIILPTSGFTYYFAVYNNIEGPGEFEVSVFCPEFCPTLGYEGTPCDDGNPDTSFDTVTADCECEGNTPCIASTQWSSATLPNSTEVIQVTSCNIIGDYTPISNAIAGNEYTFTTTDNSEFEPVFITVRSGTFDGPVIGAGYSPLTVTSDIDGTIFPHFTSNELCETISTGCMTTTVQCISCPLYCPDLDLAVGSPCDDGNPDTENDAVTSECECLGEQPCLNTIAYTTRTFDGTNAILSSGCTYEQEYNTFNNAELGSTYTFTSEDEGNPGFITIRSGTFDGAVLGYGFSPVSVVSNINGSLFAHYTINGACETETGCVSITGQCTSCPVYCPILDAVEGDPCDDGDPDTNFDMITADCECVGISPCLGDELWQSASMDGSNQIQTISTSNLMSDYSPVFNVTSGDQYTFTSTDNSGGDLIYITVRSGAVDGPVLGAGYSPLTVTSDINGTLYAHFSADEFCSFTSIGSFTSVVQCITCPVYCPDLDLVVGAPCDDGNPDTNFDMVTADCECAGTLPCIGDFEWQTINMPGTDEIITITSCNLTSDYNIINNVFQGEQYAFTAVDDEDLVYITVRSGAVDGPVLGNGYSPLTVTSDVDGTLYVTYAADEFCDFTSIGCFATTVQCTTCDYECPSIGANVGDACDDGNPDTTGEVINEFCECAVPSLANLSGTANWNGACGDRELVIGLFETGTDNLVAVVSGVLNSDGTYSHVGFPTGTWDVYAVLEGHLSKGYLNETLSAGNNTLNLGSFIDGDINGSNGINISDFSLLNVSFGSSSGDANYNYLADMNCDGNVNIIDVSILNIGFGMVGETPD